MPLPDKKQRIIVVGTSVRKSYPILRTYLASLDWQELPPQTKVKYVFVADFTPEQKDASDYLKAWTAERGGEILRGGGASGSRDFNDDHPATHQWSGSAMRRVGDNKNRLIRRALEMGADGLWFVDSDLICDPTTLRSLDSIPEQIVCGVYWTRWHKPTPEQVIHAAPQVWLNHPYQLHGRGLEEWEFRKKLVERQVTRVWGQGACTLIRKVALEKGVCFAPIPELPTDGMWQGEDRHFCVRAERLHITMVADPWPDIFHIYHQPEDVSAIPEMVARLGNKGQRSFPGIGDLVSLVLEPLEPLPNANGALVRLGPQPVRGRLGQLALVPELEDAVLGMKPGDDQIVPVHCGVDHPFAYFRGRRRLIRVTLVDSKTFSFPPVLENELYVSKRGGRPIDHTTLTMEQHEMIAEVGCGVTS